MHLVPDSGTALTDAHWDCIANNLIALAWSAPDVALLVSWGGRQGSADWRAEAERQAGQVWEGGGEPGGAGGGAGRAVQCNGEC